MHLRRKSISNHIKGLLEVEPLHFVCCSTSEATRIENMDSTSQAANIIDDIMIETPSQMNIGTSKLVASDHVIKMPNETIISNDVDLDSKNSQYMLAKNVVDKMFYSHMKKHKFKDSSLMSESMLNNLALFTGDEELMLLQQGSIDKNSPNDDTNARNEANSGSIYSNKVREFIEERNREDSTSPILPWHKILSVPSKQMIVVDRMHSGARRQVTLDFGFPVLLTDIIIPACNDLASLTIDTWCFDEDSDCVRLAISSDIGAKALILSDLQPPPVCRFLRLTFMGRYGMSATRCKLPMGMFYGHVVILDKDSYADPVMRFVKNKKSYIQTQLKVLNALYEDTHCRYCLSSSKLAELLQPLLKSDNSNMSHMQSYLNRLKETEDYSQEFVKISGVYEECITFQNQLNVVRNVIRRLEKSLEEEGSHQSEPENALQTLCTDKLRVISECLVELLLHFVITYGQQSIAALHNFFDLNTCNLMFKTLVINGDSHIRIATCSMLVKMCSYSVKPWWGNFFSDTFTTLFSSQNVEVFPQDR
jgi:baculoviral IAP repeat-containing protein 6 (apollon)